MLPIPFHRINGIVVAMENKEVMMEAWQQEQQVSIEKELQVRAAAAVWVYTTVPDKSWHGPYKWLAREVHEHLYTIGVKGTSDVSFCVWAVYFAAAVPVHRQENFLSWSVLCRSEWRGSPTDGWNSPKGSSSESVCANGFLSSPVVNSSYQKLKLSVLRLNTNDHFPQYISCLLVPIHPFHSDYIYLAKITLASVTCNELLWLLLAF